MRRASLLIRADGSATIGMGHAMRCLALAEVFTAQTQERATFAMNEAPASFASRAAAAGADVGWLSAAPGSDEDARETLAISHALGADWIVLDGYAFDGAFQAALVAGGRHVIALDDDGHAGHYEADLVLNPSPGADASLYHARHRRTRLLLGGRYALLRDEFRRWPGQRRAVPAQASRVVITCGGADPENISLLALEALASLDGPLEIQVLVGPANPHLPALRAAVAAVPHPVRIAADVTDMAARLAWADLAVTAAGGTMWELARVGTPMLAIVVADNQIRGARALARAGVAINLGWHSEIDAGVIATAVARLAADAPRRQGLSDHGRELVDGRGAHRVLAAMGLAAGEALAA
jgi:UDP-2,4-diacetamido-2,4,6-trideoxy-beta-L-altropyranose hydrolase